MWRWPGRITLAAVFVAAGMRPAHAAVFTVTNANDAGPGSLRQAIADSNRAQGPNVIEIDLPAGDTPHVIVLAAALPPLEGPLAVRIKGSEPIAPPQAPAGRGRGRGGATIQPPPPPVARVILDGANISGACSPGVGITIQNSDAVEVAGLEFRNFCSAATVVRSADVYLHDLRITDSRGDAVVFAGARDSLVQDSRIELTRPIAGLHGVKFDASSARDALIGNTFTGYADSAAVVLGADQTIRDNHFIDNAGQGLHAEGPNLLIFGNTFTGNGGDAMWVRGAGARVLDNVVSRNRGRGVVVASRGVTLGRNSIFGNAGPGIDRAAPSVVLPGAPVLSRDSTWTPDGLRIQGSLRGQPGERHAVEIFISRDASQMYIGTASATPGPAGKATFMLVVRIADIFGDGTAQGVVTATARDAAGTTSRFSGPLALSRRSE